MQATATILNETPIACHERTNISNVAWSAIIAGAFASTAVALVLLLLGSGLGLAAVSPWFHAGVTAVTFTVSAAIWLIIMQWIASALGGYLTGRLRSKWVDMHTDEVFFRDTAHGFLTWTLATVMTAAFLASAISTVVGGGTKAIAAVESGAVAKAATQNSGDSISDPLAYWVDRLFRSDHITSPENDGRSETTRILISGFKNGGLPDADKTYLVQLIVSHTGLSQADASKRLDDLSVQTAAMEIKIRQQADTARKTASAISIFTFLSMLIGAFIASAAAALGGQHRDRY